MESRVLFDEKRVWAEIDCAQWSRNFAAIRDYVQPAMMLPVLKSDGYGLGARAGAEAFRNAGAQRVAVAALGEALEIQDLGLEIQFLGMPVEDEIPGIVKLDAIGSVPDYATACLFEEAATQQSTVIRVHFLVDSGMGRLGTLLRDAEAELVRIQALPHLVVEGIYSHLPAAERHGNQTLGQIQLVSDFIQNLEDQNVAFRYRHIANSCASAGLEAVSGPPFNMVRPGIDLHGVLPFGISRPYEVKPVFSLKTRLVSVRALPAGFTVGYGRTHALQRESLVGTVAIGYADGYPVKLANTANMLVNGHRCPVVGSVCMDYCQLILDDVPNAKPGDEVTVIGREQNEEITTKELAELAGTIEYEILCRLGRRVYKRYCHDGV